MKLLSMCVLALISACSVYDRNVSIYDQAIASGTTSRISFTDLEDIREGERVKVIYFDRQVSIDGRKQLQREVRGGTLTEISADSLMVVRRFLGAKMTNKISYDQLEQIRYGRNKGKVWRNRLVGFIPVAILGVAIPIVISENVSD